jgi:hypothetical protein
MSLFRSHLHKSLKEKSTLAPQLLQQLCWALVLSAIFTTQLVGCTKTNTERIIEDGTGNTQSAKSGTAETDETKSNDPVVRAEALADQGEKLFAAMNISDAYGQFSAASELDPTNARVKFWRGILKPVLEMKGIVTRVRPLYLSHPQGAERYAAMRASYETPANSPATRFMLEGPEDIRTVEDFFNWLDHVRGSFMEMREALRSLRESEITIKLPAGFTLSDYNNVCRPTQFGPIRWGGITNPCDPTMSNSVGLNRADFEALLVATSYFQAQIELLTAYRINPMALMIPDEDMAKSSVDNKTTTEIFMRRLLDIENGGKLSSSKPFMGVIDGSKDLLIGMKFMLQHQYEICRQDTSLAEDRPGYLFNFGLCPSRRPGETDSWERTVNVLESILAGNGYAVPETTEHPDDTVFLMKFLTQPPEDLHDFFPFESDNCGRSYANLKPLSPYFKSGLPGRLLTPRRDQGCTNRPRERQ